MPTAAPPLFFVIDVAGGGGAPPPALAARLQASRRAHELLHVRQASERRASIGRAVNAARQARGAVVAVGEPSTVNAVLQAAWNAQLPLAVLPPDAPAAALDALLGARPRPRPLGCVGDRVFLHGAELGLRLTLPAPQPGAAPATTPAALARELGTLLAGRSLLTLQLQCQGELRVVRTRGLRVAAPTARPRLGVLARPALPAAASAALLLRAAWVGARQAREADVFEADALQLEGARRQRRLSVWVDGEALELPLPLSFEVAPRPLLWLDAG